MQLPPLVNYDTPTEYKAHYLRNYCRMVIHTFDNIRVFFKPEKFDHAFYESSLRNGSKNEFSTVRAQRIDWIRLTLESPVAETFIGWDQKKRLHDPKSRVAVLYEDFVVIVAIRLKRDQSLKADFVTCYQADNSIGKIRRSPVWSLTEFINVSRL